MLRHTPIQTAPTLPPDPLRMLASYASEGPRQDSSMLYARPSRPPSATPGAMPDGEYDAMVIKSFQRLERILNDVKGLCSTHESPETRKLYDLFAEYGGPVQIVLEFAKTSDCTNSKVYQVLRDIVAKTLYSLSCKLGPGQDPVHSYADLAYQWEQLLKAAPPSLQRTLTDNFSGLVRELLQPRPSLERLEMVIRRVGFLLMQELPLDLHNINSVNANHNLNMSRAITPPSSSIYSAYPPGPGPDPHHQSNDWGNRGGGGELPRRPFKSRECDFFKQGKCNKEMCNFAHGHGEKDWWTAKYQSMMPCKTPGCVGRAGGCPLAHALEEQSMAKREYEDVVAAATATAMPVGSVSHGDQPAFSPYIVAPESAVPTPSLSPAPPRQWLGKNELPRPFRSKLCEFFATNGVCAKQMCNYAHEANEIVAWSTLFQTMFRCNTKNCPGRQNGCTFSHTPEEQLASRAKYDELVAHARSLQQREDSGHWENNRSPRSEVSLGM